MFIKKNVRPWNSNLKTVQSPCVRVCTERGMLAARPGLRLPRADVAAGDPAAEL